MEHQLHLPGAWASPGEVEDWDLGVDRVQEPAGNSLVDCPLRL